MKRESRDLSLEGPILNLIKKQVDHIGSEKSSLLFKCRSIEDKIGLLIKQLEVSEKYKSEYLRRYEDAINDKKKLADDYTSRITNLQSKGSSLEERSSAAEARLSATCEQAQSAQEAGEWKRKFDVAVREAKAALEKAATVQDHTSKQTQLREDTLRAEFSTSLAEKEEEIKVKAAKIEYAEQHLTTLSLELKTADSKLKNYDLETSALMHEIKDLAEKLETIKVTAQSFEREACFLEQEKTNLKQKYLSEFKRFEELQERCKIAKMEARRATYLADNVRAEAATAQKEKSDIQQVVLERLAKLETVERHIESLDRLKADLVEEVERFLVTEMNALSKVALLEARVEEREKEIESLKFKSSRAFWRLNEQPVRRQTVGRKPSLCSCNPLREN
ncbi:hypothetical protein HHK36_023601 [Tetracentron sinense]|uniref:Uncharacterized protein n=1 Tax=Tetracentron sinense TaxID=13715 RepID=A0A834YLN7_TETSI|nr:hypothetical protein HHK36_023601 [Tetracentron sinense]